MKRYPEEYQLEIFKLQKENLQLSNKQLNRYWLYTLASFLLGVASTLITHEYTKDTKDMQKLSYKIDSIKAVVQNLEDSIESVRAYNTNGKDTLNSK